MACSAIKMLSVSFCASYGGLMQTLTMIARTGEASVREANAARFRQTCEREFEAFRKERLATGELECQKLITAAQAHLTQVWPHSTITTRTGDLSSGRLMYSEISDMQAERRQASSCPVTWFSGAAEI